MKKIVITGGCGFVGSHVAEYLFKKFYGCKFIILDKLTYAGNIKFLKKISQSKRIKIITGDINNKKLVTKITKGADLMIHLAAESHVDRSFLSIKKFMTTNIFGTQNIMHACLLNNVKKIIHISTDEVYGEAINIKFKESDVLSPTNPYSSSKAAAEMIVNSYKKSFNLNAIIVRANNIYGVRQFPEKIIPKCCISLIHGKKITVHGNGKQLRTFLHIEDFTNAIFKIILNWKKNEIYNIGSTDEHKIIDIVKHIIKKFKKNNHSSIKYVNDRPFNDFRYSINYNKISKLGWRPKRKFNENIDEIIKWYVKNHHIFKKR